MLVWFTLLFVYYLSWLFLTPFLDQDSIIQNLYPPIDYAIKIPLFLLLIAFVTIGTYVSLLLINSNQPREHDALRPKGQKIR
ncbi:hypothetical protein WICANDRAFT_28825 [Wickerhamomyces anomalus NRRL Y-366-8]|uniref:Dolichol phosphate-mannose biosynthesis regulatory protein n=1 Tax=Wickerhamomyces anomalus (strain ATCC 58044 / CBS 1984 / NCYC 433 / NRRL Y-366-8) TaxID=683960 RepID=A0A1E3P8L5_WICAA|nr:uncharacterized protein WICANDRAFT_28825 [Wickerhamomyces anomalus NRRL Y-366-8]ODQ61292.1 hypothetical protein WICANDRAFT_28825 [Wickerhamomyces anomalus NRRL Y-366-8]